VRSLAIVHQRDAGPGVFAEAAEARGWALDVWHRAETDEPPGDPAGYGAVFSFGGAMNVDEEEAHPWLREEKELLGTLLAREVPLMGVCLGAQLLSAAAGGSPRRAREPEIGWRQVEVTPEGDSDQVIGPLAPGFEAFQWHSYEAAPPATATVLARSEVCVQAYRLGERAWGIQFHAEVDAPTVEHWIADYRADPDAVRLGVDPSAMRAEARPRLPAWNELGRSLCARFLDLVMGMAR
jgi:GMP synthase (glutamine-hydrolysing)